MYIPTVFEQTDQNRLYDFIETHSFGLLVSTHQDEPFDAPTVLYKTRSDMYSLRSTESPK